MNNLLETEKKKMERIGYLVLVNRSHKGVFDMVAIPCEPLQGSVLGYKFADYSREKPRVPKELKRLKSSCVKLWITRKRGSRWVEPEREYVD